MSHHIKWNRMRAVVLAILILLALSASAQADDCGFLYAPSNACAQVGPTRHQIWFFQDSNADGSQNWGRNDRLIPMYYSESGTGKRAHRVLTVVLMRGTSLTAGSVVVRFGKQSPQVLRFKADGGISSSSYRTLTMNLSRYRLKTPFGRYSARLVNAYLTFSVDRLSMTPTESLGGGACVGSCFAAR